MNDPWDVKSVRQSGQYVSCIKINGVPLLPPVLSKECRKEMQYYKLLAKEVEKRIAFLQPYYVDSDTESSDKTDAPELPDSEQNDDIPEEDIQPGFNININNITNVVNKIDDIDSPVGSFNKTQSPGNKYIEKDKIDATVINSSNFVIDLSVNINEKSKIVENTKNFPPPTEIPERDYDSPKKEKVILTEYETVRKPKGIKDVNLSFESNKELSEPFHDMCLHQDGPSSISSKSFTGSLIDIHTESMKDSHLQPLTRQRSYTLLKPSPQLLAHLEVQSLNTGVEMTCISMSESLSNLSSPGKKRRSWDLESAKVKWSSMALELKQKEMPNIANKIISKNGPSTPVNRKQATPRARSLIVDKTKRAVSAKTLPKSEPIQKPKKVTSPVREGNGAHAPKPPSPNNSDNKKEQAPKQTALISESEDPATRVRELYEKIQKQQLLQMASLVEKQKREQMLLQQVFEEQNNLLYKQLKTICPKSPVEVKEAWLDERLDVDRGPVSLSQLIDKPIDKSDCDSPSSTLTDTHNYINHCDKILQKSRDITLSLKKQTPIKSASLNGSQISSSRQQNREDGSRTRTHSPSQKNSTSRRLIYDSSGTSDPEYEPILTDRTSDTLADLNVTFPSDRSDGSYNSVILNLSKELTSMKTNPNSPIVPSRSTDNAIRNMEKSIHNSINTMRSNKGHVINSQPSPRERAAACKIVACAKGYLVRRLMRTERVQGTVQTIRDALLCALQLHQEREGIRGADVDLHRRLIQQITAACYSLHDTFVASTPAERCALIAADRGRRRALAARPQTKLFRQADTMSQSFSGPIPARSKRPTASSLMTQSNYETFSGEKSAPVSRSRYMPSPRRRPWR